jgi:hypothetical protein
MRNIQLIIRELTEIPEHLAKAMFGFFIDSKRFQKITQLFSKQLARLLATLPGLLKIDHPNLERFLGAFFAFHICEGIFRVSEVNNKELGANDEETVVDTNDTHALRFLLLKVFDVERYPNAEELLTLDVKLFSSSLQAWGARQVENN